jgi:hypothetical protein
MHTVLAVRAGRAALLRIALSGAALAFGLSATSAQASHGPIEPVESGDRSCGSLA